MERHLSDDELEQYRSRTASPKELVIASNHLASCDTCYKRFNTQDSTAATYEFVRHYLGVTGESSPDHLLYEQMAGYADESLEAAETEVVREHIKDCSECDSDVKDLLRIKGIAGPDANFEGIGSERAGEWASKVGAMAAGVRVTGAGAGVAGLGQSGAGKVSEAREASNRGRRIGGDRAVPYWQQPVFRTALQAACLVAVVVIAVWVLTRGLRSEVKRLEQEAAVLQQSNEELRQQAADAERLQAQV